MLAAERMLGVLPAGTAPPRPIFRDSTRIGEAPVVAVQSRAAGMDWPSRFPDCSIRRGRRSSARSRGVADAGSWAAGRESALLTISDQSPASVLAIRTSSARRWIRCSPLLDARVTVAQRDSQPATPDLLQCEAAGDWRYCLVIAAARATPPSNDRLDALATYLRGSQTPLPLWP
jgi:hypothetical protein